MLGAAIFSMFFLLALYMQQPCSATRRCSGVGYLLVASRSSSRPAASQALVGRFGVRPCSRSGLVAAARWACSSSRRSRRTARYLGDLAPGFVLAGVGLGFAFIPVTIAALMGITDDEAGLASGLINTSQQIGGALGVADSHHRRRDANREPRPSGRPGRAHERLPLRVRRRRREWRSIGVVAAITTIRTSPTPADQDAARTVSA